MAVRGRVGSDVRGRAAPQNGSEAGLQLIAVRMCPVSGSVCRETVVSLAHAGELQPSGLERHQ
jgi:hypothetical protein